MGLFGLTWSLLLVAVAQVALADAPPVAWRSEIGSQNYERANGVARGLDSGFVVVGSQYFGPGLDHSVGYVAKVDKNGNPVWTDTVGHVENGIEEGAFFFAVPMLDHGFVLVGRATNGLIAGGPGEWNWFVKVDSIGQVIWESYTGYETLSDPLRYYWVQDAKPTADGGIILCGDYNDETHFDPGYWTPLVDPVVWKVNSSGSEEWRRHFESFPPVPPALVTYDFARGSLKVRTAATWQSDLQMMAMRSISLLRISERMEADLPYTRLPVPRLHQVSLPAVLQQRRMADTLRRRGPLLGEESEKGRS